jgi:hypothetical protein
MHPAGRRMRSPLRQACDARSRHVIADLFTLRLRVFVQREWLDRQLAEGGDPVLNPALGVRAAQLCRARTCRVIARRLRRALRNARKATSPRLGFRPLARDQILAESDALEDLIRRLEAPARAKPMGIALARLLVVEPVSPVYAQAEAATLSMVVRLATAAMGASVERPDATR